MMTNPSQVIFRAGLQNPGTTRNSPLTRILLTLTACTARAFSQSRKHPRNARDNMMRGETEYHV